MDSAPADGSRTLISGGLGSYCPAQLRGSVRQRAGDADERRAKVLRDQGCSNGRPCPSSEGGPEDEGKRRSGAPRGERPASLGVRRKAFEMLPAPFGAPLPSPLVREHSPHEPRGWEMPALPAP